MIVSVKRKGEINLSIREIEKTLLGTQKEVSTLALAHYLKGFRERGGRTDDSKTKWASKKNGEQSHLTKTGDLKRDLRVILVSKDLIKLGTGSITERYAKVHNEGTNGVKREFLGKSKVLNEKILKLYKGNLIKYFKNGWVI